MLGDLVAEGSDFRAAIAAGYPSRAAFQKCLAAGGIHKPAQEVVDLHTHKVGEKDTGLGHYILKCGHAMPVAGANKARRPKPGESFKRPCAHCARQRFENGDPEVAREYAEWARQQFEALRKSGELSVLEPQRRQALGTAIQRFTIAAGRAARHVSNTIAARSGPPAVAA